jgi:HAD superfamily hydrolase (TIGR01459 family)
MASPNPRVPPHDGPLLPKGLADLASHYDVLLCDLWGVVHDGKRVFEPAIDALRRFRQKGGTVVFITNAPRPSPPVLAQLDGLGVAADAFDGIVTSGDVTVGAIAARGDAPLHHIGPPRDLVLFDAVEQLTGRRPPLGPLETAAYVVVTGLNDDSRETPADYAARLASMRERGLPMICANPDLVVHVGETIIYCGGALAEAYAEAGGETIQAGKPHPPIYQAALTAAAEKRGGVVDLTRVLAIGDAVRTDVAGAAGQGIDVLFVTSGIHRDEFHPRQMDVMDRLAIAERLTQLGHRPLAAIPQLVW